MTAQDFSFPRSPFYKGNIQHTQAFEIVAQSDYTLSSLAAASLELS